MNKALHAIAVATAAISGFASETITWGSSSWGYSMSEAADYNQSANWNGGIVPNSETTDYAANFDTGAQDDSFKGFVKSDVAVRVHGMTASGVRSGRYVPALAYVSDQPLALEPSSGLSYGMYFYCPIAHATAGAPYFMGCDICGSVTGTLHPIGYGFRHRLDLYADHAGGTRADYEASKVDCNDSQFSIVPPDTSLEDVTGVWATTAGSRYLARISHEGALPVGTIVTGDGIPSGTFLKRIFPDGSIELSQAATATAGGVSLTFAKMTANVTEHLTMFSQNTQGKISFLTGRKLESDSVTVEVDSLFSYSESYGATLLSTIDGCLPASVILHDTTEMQSSVTLGNADLTFAANPNGAAGFPRTAITQESADQNVSFTVPAGVDAVISNFQGMTATYVKRGAGTLTLLLSENSQDNTGTITVETGSLEIVGPQDAGQAAIAKIVVKQGATLVLGEGTLRAGSVEAESGAVLKGPGALYAPGDAAAKFVFVDGASIILTDAGTYGSFDDPAPATAAEIAGYAPALWLAVDDGSTIVTQTAGDDTLVMTWNDVRGTGFGSAEAMDADHAP